MADESGQQAEREILYRSLIQKIYKISLIQVRQLMGNQPPTDPRVAFVAGLQFHSNMVNAQIMSLLNILQEILRVLDSTVQLDPTEVQLGELLKQVKELQTDLCIKDWSEDGEPLLDLVEYKKRTEGWPE